MRRNRIGYVRTAVLAVAVAVAQMACEQPDASESGVEVVEEVLEKDLPKPVADARHSHPRAIYVSGWKVTRGGSVEYRLTVRGTRKTAMVAKPDGTVLSFK